MSNKAVRKFYKKSYPVSFRVTGFHQPLYKLVRSIKPKTIFEFGCNSGKNLNQLRQFECSGIDLCERAITQGRLIFPHLKLDVGDEKTVAKMRNSGKYYDLIMTVSVLNHIADISHLLPNLQKMCNHLVMYESTGYEDWTHFNHQYPGKVMHTQTSKRDNREYKLYYDFGNRNDNNL